MKPIDKKSILYARVSTKDQEREGFSIPAQRKFLSEYAVLNALKVVREFIEADSAKDSGRKAFNEMLQFLDENPDVRHILVEKTDRLYRNLKDYARLDLDSRNQSTW